MEGEGSTNRERGRIRIPSRQANGRRGIHEHLRCRAVDFHSISRNNVIFEMKVWTSYLVPALILFTAIHAGELRADSGAAAAWDTVYPGVSFMSRMETTEDGIVRFHAARIDLDASGAELIVSPPSYKGARTSTFARDMGAQVAINGGFWTLVTHKPLGLLVTAGRKWKDAADDEEYGFLGVDKDGKAWISPPEEVYKNPAKSLSLALSGTPMIVRQGRVAKVNGCGYVCMKHPRAAVGLDQAGKSLFLVVSDGRQEDSASISLKSLARFMLDIGVWDALNLDGGGSATLFIDKLGGIVNKPCEGRERSVLNSMAIVLPDEDEAAGAAGMTSPGLAQAGLKKAVFGGPATVMFSNEDFEREGSLEYPPRMVSLAKVAGLLSAVVFLALASSCLLLMRRRRRA
jgi:hypothetical protein